jgi:hypothetical protein
MASGPPSASAVNAASTHASGGVFLAGTTTHYTAAY